LKIKIYETIKFSVVLSIELVSQLNLLERYI
jgi:hypothetical protein